MDLTLQRDQYRSDGIFGRLIKEDGSIFCVTIEHSYQYKSKIPAGIYTCQRGQHQLEGMLQPFTTFEVMNVPNHTNILIHWANYQKDVSGCIGVGDAILNTGQVQFISNSKVTFNKLMDLQAGLDTFQLTVKD